MGAILPYYVLCGGICLHCPYSSSYIILLKNVDLQYLLVKCYRLLLFTYAHCLCFYLEILEALSTPAPTAIMASITTDETTSTASTIVNATANTTVSITVRP